MELREIATKAESMKTRLGLTSSPVGVSFIFSKDDSPSSDCRILNGYRYCQALMEARRGDHVILNKEGISCPAAAAAFGFKPLPPGLQSGKGLTGFGITKEDDTGKTMFEGMTVLEPGKLQELYLFPLESAVVVPDVVVVEDEVEKLMWIALARLNAQGGRRIESSTAVLQRLRCARRIVQIDAGCRGACPASGLFCRFREKQIVTDSKEFLGLKV